MRRLGPALGGAGAAFAASLLLVGPINWVEGTSSDDPTPSAPPTSAPPSAEPSENPPKEPDGGDDDESCDAKESIRDFLADQNFRQRDYVIGVSEVDWSARSTAHTDDAFSRPLRTQAALLRFLEADTKRSAAARSLIGDDFVTPGQWEAVQFLNPVRYTGNWYWQAGSAVQGGEQMVLAGDVWWLNVDYDDCSVEPSDALRAICGNVGFNSIVLAVPRRN